MLLVPFQRWMAEVHAPDRGVGAEVVHGFLDSKSLSIPIDVQVRCPRLSKRSQLNNVPIGKEQHSFSLLLGLGETPAPAPAAYRAFIGKEDTYGGTFLIRYTKGRKSSTLLATSPATGLRLSLLYKQQSRGRQGMIQHQLEGKAGMERKQEKKQ